MAKRWGVKNKINKRIAHLKWLLIKNQIPAQKLQEEFDFLVNKKPITSAHSVIKTINKDTKTRKNATVEYLVYQIPFTQLKGEKGNGDMQAAKRD